jgi:glyoxylase-like metal-dependent hydrolase (beta-lactamase superfamily II)
MPEGIKPSEQMLMVANDIAERCGGKLDIVVATHRHKDHISGFTTNDDETASGNIIARLKPHMVIQPWTEDPALKDPKLPPLKRRGAQGMQASAPARFLSSLHAMNLLAESAHREVQHLTSAKFRQPLAAEVA